MKVFVLVLVMTAVVVAGSTAKVAPLNSLNELAAQLQAKKASSSVAPTVGERELETHSSEAIKKTLHAIEVDGFGQSTIIRSNELSPLEAQISELQRQAFGNGSPQTIDEVSFANLKEQLNELYALRPENQERNPLDQGEDDCPGLVITEIPFYDTGSTVGLANDFSPISPCNSTNAPDVVYEFTPTVSDFYNISLMGSSYDTYLYVHTLGACPGLFSVGCNDDSSPSFQSYLSLFLTAGQVYYIIVDGYNNNAGSYVLNITGNCGIECQPGDVSECGFEEVGGDPVYDCNYFCNGYNDVQSINLFQTVCGRTWAANGHHDEDWYYFQIFEPCSLDITLRTEVPLRLQLNSYPSFDCNFTTYFNQFLAFPCSTVTYRVPCVQPGEYTLLLATDALNIASDFREYRVRVDALPCSGCRIDAFLQAPGTIAGNTCGAGNHNSLAASEDLTYMVNIPFASDWTFSMCNGDSIWDSHIYLSTFCNSSVLADNDDGCGGVGLSKISCVELMPGTYYLTVEHYSEGCGPFVLDVSTCTGRCCYGDLYDSPSCLFTSLTICNDFGGVFTEGPSCDIPCPVRPQCPENGVVSQPPMMPTEPGTGHVSHVDYGVVHFDNYASATAIASARFWGFPVVCNGAPETFRIEFTDGANTCQYDVTATGLQLPEVYFDAFHLSQYDVVLDPPCGIPSGNVSIAKLGDAGCQWYWSTSIAGDNIHPSGIAEELAFCLGSPCLPADSVTIKWAPADNIVLNWWQPRAGNVHVWLTTNQNAVFPSGYLDYAQVYCVPGHNSEMLFGPFPSYVNAVLVVDCGFVPPVSAPVSDPAKLLNEEKP